nr:hypothetical protein BaRGS_013153 [Batillaria attramentaria]
MKDPVITSTQRVLYGQTPDGHPIVAKATYTRVEATLPDRSRSEQLSQASQPSVSEGMTSVKSKAEEEAKWSPAALERQMAAELARLESLEDSLRQLSSADRTRAVALAQQETVSVAQVLKARQQAHSAELRNLQLQVQEERLASAKLLQQFNTTGVQTSLPASRDASRTVSSRQLLEQAENRRPDSRSGSLSRSKNRDDTEYSESVSSTARKVSNKTSSRYSQSSSTATKTRTGTTESVKTAEDSQADSDSSIKTASDMDARPADNSIPLEVPDDYSLSFEDSMTEEESFKQVLPSESHRKDAKRRKSDGHKPQHTDEASSLALGDLTSLFVGEDSFSRFTAEMVRQIMREEELRAQHQAALLRLREKALKEKTKAELAWLRQQQQQLRNKGKDDVHPQLAKKEQKLLKQLQEQQAEIRQLQEANRLASKERQSLLKQHEQIARMQQETRDKMKTLQGRLGRPDEVHTEDDMSMVDGNLYLTAREQRLLERKKHASELLKWKQDLDAEEEKVLQLERHALQAWEGREGKKGASTDKKRDTRDETEKKEDLSSARERTPSRPDKRLDSSDDTIVNSSVDEEMDTPVRKGKKSPVETQSDVSDYEVRIRQLSDMLRRRRKEADMLKKERSKRQKDKLKAQEETLKKQLEAYENYIAQVKAEQADLEHEGGRPAVRPQIKKPHVVSPNKSMVSPATSPGPASRRSRDEGSNSSSLDEARDGTDSNQTSPAPSDGFDAKVSPLSDKGKKKSSTSSLMDRISEGSESDRSRLDAKKSREKAGSRSTSDQSVSEAIEEAVDEASVASSTSKSAVLQIKTSLPSPADAENHSLADENASYSLDFTDAVSQSLGQSRSKIPVSIRSDGSRAKDESVVSARGGKSEAEVSEYIESAALSTAKSEGSSGPKFDLKSPQGSTKEAPASAASSSQKSGPKTGIQESDSENESRHNSHRSLSRPSSERSTGSTTYSDIHDLDEEEDIISSESDRTPVKATSVSQKEKSAAPNTRTDDDISEHISASLPSISEKRSVSGALVFGQQDSLDAALGDLLGPPEEEDATPTDTPRAESPHLGQDDNNALLMTDPLADFHEGDRVMVGRLSGVLRFKGTVDFAPGFWAGVELDKSEGDTDGERDGKRYFTCNKDHGVLVPGSDISPIEENGVAEKVQDAGKSLDESLTDQDEVSSATEGEKSEPSRMSVGEKEEEKTPVKEKSPQREKRNLDLLADDITADLTKSLVSESVQKMNSIALRQSSPAKVPPPTLPKPKLKPQQPQQEQEDEVTSKPSADQDQRVNSATSAVVGNLLDDAISTMMQIRRGRQDSQTTNEVLHNGYSDDSGVDRSHDSSMDPALGVTPEPESGSSPERHELDEDLSGLLGDEEFIDEDDYGLSKPPPPYPGAGDQASGPDRLTNSQKSTEETGLYIVPHQRAEVEGIVADAVSIFWNLRRCGESWESAAPPASFLQESAQDSGGGDDMEASDLVTGSRRIYKQLLFDLTGEIVREIYQHENEEDPPPWQKPEQKRQRYFKGRTPPTTMDVLLPLVQSTVVDILGLNGSTGKFRGRVMNKWNVRKKKDHVDAVLVEELREEEADWINYDHDELAVKMQLTDTLFDSLLSDTVETLNRVYAKRQARPHP